MRHHTMLWLSVLVILVATACANADNCMQLRDKPGYTVPPGDISVEYGKPLEILCVLDAEHDATAGSNASDIAFERNGSPVPSKNVQVVNSTTARLYMEHAEPAGNAYYYCLLKPSGRKPTTVCMNRVAVGYPPRDLKIENFTCVSRHLKNLNCTWQVPENPIKTTYSISYTYGLPETRYLNGVKCPDENSPNFGYCYWDDKTDPMYREKDETYYFKISAENVLGNHTFEEIEFNQWAHALLDKPEFLNGSSKTTSSVYLHWQIDPNLKPLPLKYKLLYKSETSECDTTDEWKQVDTSDFNWKRSSFNLTDLPYANFLYDVRLYIAPAKAKGDDVWSEPAAFTFRTEPMPPASPPELAPGSFQVIGKESTRDVLIFWKRLPRCRENGDDFRYKVVAKEVGTAKPELEDPQPKSSYARFSNLSLNAYEVSVYAVNKEGSSKPAVILIPEKVQTPPQASRIVTVVKENGVVQLNWDRALPEVGTKKAESFTVFWCQNEQLTSVHCSGLLNSAVVSSEKAEATIQTRPGKVYEFGVAVNSGNASSGITWVTCTLRPDSVYGRVSMPIVLKTAATFLEISFKVDCLNGLKSAHYQVQYCAIDGPTKPQCRGAVETLAVSTNSTEVLVNVTELQPYTTYRLSVIPADEDGKPVGDRSKWVNVTTMETRPSPPRNVTLEEVTGERAVVSWLEPLPLNGVLQRYVVRYGGRAIDVAAGQGTRVALPVDGDREYSVVVEACTNQGCTPAPRPLALRSRVGPPGPVARVAVRPQPAGRLALAWEAPVPPGGPRHLYQALLLHAASGRNRTLPLRPAAPHNLTDVLDVPFCDADPDASYKVAVRAINLDEHNGMLLGNWSEWTDAYCRITGGLQKGRVLLWCAGTLGVLAACAALVVGGRRLARWWRLARGVQVKLPPGLAPPPADKRDRDEEGCVRTPWLLYGREKAAAAPRSPSHEETTLLRGGGVARCDSGGGGSSAGTGSDCALSSLTSATTAASDSDGDAEADAAGGKPRAARQWSTFSDGSVSRSTPNLWEAEAAPPHAAYCRAGLPEAPAAGYVTVASAPYVRRGSLDGWPHTVAAAAAAPAIPAGYTQMGANNELVAVAELKTPSAAHNLNDNGTSRGYVPRPAEAAPAAAKQQLVLTPLTQWAPNHSTVPYVTAARPQQQQTAPTVWPSIRCEMPTAAATAAPAAARGYVSVDNLPPPPASSAPSAPGASPTPAGYVVCSSGRPPDGYVTAGPPPPAQTPTHHCKPGGAYVLLGEAAGAGRLPPPAAAPARGYISLQQLERT
ncbi:cytokine receptor-like [Schistocerca gregaria]|uniref:cytokine receptor-like n=1 Tax=Schistocerca gregaria TaxID=7010 RepID=UPI00211E4DF7|nr:cytokine receptor-like [Schistocerca gregaria]